MVLVYIATQNKPVPCSCRSLNKMPWLCGSFTLMLHFTLECVGERLNCNKKLLDMLIHTFNGFGFNGVFSPPTYK